MPNEILKFWFTELEPSQWWISDNALDETIRERFTHVHTKAASCELYKWRESAKGRLAEIIVLDQFSRNMFRGSARSFATDSLALALSQEAISVAADQELTALERSFLYMPFMHSESLEIHIIAADLFLQNGIESNYDFEIKHKVIIERFGRYPHRNKVLGRTSTEAETEFLKQPNSRF